MQQKKSYVKLKLVAGTCLLLTGLWLTCTYANIGHTHVILNEVCSQNDGIIYDTAGHYHDYVEIYNPTSDTQEIGGLYLSDDKDELDKYMFPWGTVLESGEYLLLWAGEWTPDILLEDNSFYTEFALKSGETLFLSTEEGEILDKVKIPEKIQTHTSYSRTSLWWDAWKMTEASPGTENNLETPKKVELKAKVSFSVESGFYDEPFWLELDTDDRYTIYYTLDGSVPTIESQRYDGEIWIEDVSSQDNKYADIEEVTLLEDMYFPTEKVTKATVIRAIAVDAKGRVSEESCATYFVDFEEKSEFDKIPVISLITDPENLFDSEKGIYVTGKVWEMHKKLLEGASEYWRTSSPTNFQCKEKGWQRDAVVQYFDQTGNQVLEQQVGIRIHGKTSASYNQKSFNLYAFPEIDGNKYVFQGLLGEEDTTLMLRNGGGDCFGTKLRDVLTQELVSDRYVATTAYQACQVFLNGEYWGLYFLQQRVSENLVSNQYNVDENNVVLLKSGNVVAGEETDIELWQAVENFAKENDLSISYNYEMMEEMIDIQSYIDHVAFQIYVANCDSLASNLSMWRVKEKGEGEFEDGKWRWILYDIDSSTGAIQGFTTAEVDSFISGNWYCQPLYEEMFASLLKNEEFKRRFVISFMDMANYNFDSEKVTVRLDELEEQLTAATVASQQRFYSPDYTEEDYKEQINEIREFFIKRYDYITSYMKTDMNLEGELTAITVQNGMGGSVKLNTINLDEGENFTGKYFSDYDIELSAEADEGYQFIGFMVNDELYVETELVLTLDKEYSIVPLWEKQ